MTSKPPPTHDQLKQKQRNLRDGFPTALALRTHRAISWVGRAEREKDDLDAAFIFLWVAFNACYARDIRQLIPSGERSSFEAFFGQLINLDNERQIYNAIWTQFAGPIRVLLDNRYVFQPFWNHHNGMAGFENWEQQFENNRQRSVQALQKTNTKVILSTLFDRLYVLRNQLVHGGATWNSAINRNQVRDGVSILSFLLPIFIDLQMENPTADWGKPFYPVVD